MKIDINNYEAYLLDYLEGNISPKDKAMLLSFLDDNPELKRDLDVPVDLKLPNFNSPSFDSAFLKKHESEEYELSPIEYLYIKEQEEGLSEIEKNEQILLEPDANKRTQEQKLYSVSFLKPDLNIRFNSKSQLKHFAIINYISQIRIQHVAAVIAVLLIASAIWFTPKQYTQDSVAVLINKEETSANHSENNLIAATEPKIDKTPLIIKTPPSKDSLLQIAKDPMGKKKNVKTDNTPAPQTKTKVNNARKLMAITDVYINTTEEINGYEYALNVMMPQYLSNNILSRELADIYKKIEKEEEVPTKNIALVESGVKFINFFSKDAVSLDKYYDKEGNLIGYNLQGNGLSVKRNAQ